MGLDVNAIMELPAIGQVIANAIDSGRGWGEEFLNDPKWHGNKDRMADHAIYEAALWSIGSGALTGLGGGLVMLVGVPADVSFSLYSQVKLASTLFTIYGVDTREKSAQPLVLAAAAGVTVSELATRLGTSAGTKAIKSALLSVPGKVFTEINKALGIKLISKAGEKTLVNVAKLMPFVGGVVGGTVNGVMMNACGHSTIAFIKSLR
jgi:uncharacterized protein (DUF697 family)